MLRHTLHVPHSIERIAVGVKESGHDILVPLTRSGISYHEVRLTTDLEHETLEVLRGLQNVRLVYRSRHVRDFGDILVSEDIPGLSIHVKAHSQTAARIQTRSTMATWDGSTPWIGSYQALEWLQLACGVKLESSMAEEESLTARLLDNNSQSLSAFTSIESGTYAFWHSSTASAASLLKLLLRTHKDELGSHLRAAGQVEVSFDLVSGKRVVRILREIIDDQELIIASHHRGDSIELGLVERQGRDLPDTEIKGLSTFLPKIEFAPFVIFFDQRLRPGLPILPAVETEISGKGSHLTFTSTARPKIQVPEHVLDEKLRMLDERGCEYFGLYTLPKGFFFDKYEMKQRLKGCFEVWGEQHLEAPEYTTRSWGSIMKVQMPSGYPESQNAFQVPFHARYGAPARGSEPLTTLIDAPRFVYSCPLADAAFQDNPWEVPHGGLMRALFGAGSEVRLLDTIISGNSSSKDGSQTFTLSTPVADAALAQTVSFFTIFAVLAGFLLLTVLSFRARRKTVIVAADKKVS
ncbi:protease B nonderepressible form [Savitreella phatthalungensis]